MITRILRSSSVCLLLLIFLAGSTGITFYIHTCGSSHQKEVFLFHEIFHQKVDCSCEENQNGDQSSVPVINDNDCCRISHLFIKASFLGFPVVEKSPVPYTQWFVSPGFLLIFTQPVQDSKASFIPFRDPSPPPIFGRSLVYFLHQIRIPFAIC